MITLDIVKKYPLVKVLMEKANKNLGEIGYTEHGERHARIVAGTTQYILEQLGYDKKTQTMGSVAGFLHDIGNSVNRKSHGQSSAFLTYEILKDLRASYDEIAEIMAAVGNHDETDGEPVSPISAAVVIADKSDVHSSRVRTLKEIDFDIHDRVNYAVKRSRVLVNRKKKTITLELHVDTRVSTVMEYFEIFLTRMMASQRAARILKCEFKLIINKNKLL